MSRLSSLALIVASLASAAPAGADAISELEKRARKTPKESGAALELGEELRRAGLQKQAAAMLHRAILRAKGGDVATLRYARARALIEGGEQKGAQRECQELTKIAYVKGHACQAEALLLWRRASVAVPAAKLAVDRDPNDYDAAVAHGRALRQNGSPEEAERELRRAASSIPGRWEAHYHLGLLLEGSGRGSDAEASYEKARGAAPKEPVVLVALARILGKTSRAVDLLNESLAIRPSDGVAHALLGQTLLALGKAAEAESALARAIAIDGKQVEWRVTLAQVHLANGKADLALKEALAAQKIVGNNAGAKLAEADALAAKGDIDLAIDAYESAHGLARGDTTPLVRAVAASLAGARPTTARAFADRAVAEFPEAAAAWVALGDVLVKAGEKREARDAYQRALTKPNVDRVAVQKKLSDLK